MDLITSANSWKDFEQSLSSLGTTEKGSAFEELTRLYLLTEPTFSTKIKKIWHHSEVPQKIVEGGVTGIIAERSFQALGMAYRALRNSPKFKQVNYFLSPPNI